MGLLAAHFPKTTIDPKLVGSELYARLGLVADTVTSAFAIERNRFECADVLQRIDEAALPALLDAVTPQGYFWRIDAVARGDDLKFTPSFTLARFVQNAPFGRIFSGYYLDETISLDTQQEGFGISRRYTNGRLEKYGQFGWDDLENGLLALGIAARQNGLSRQPVKAPQTALSKAFWQGVHGNRYIDPNEVALREIQASFSQYTKALGAGQSVERALKASFP